MTMEKNNDDNSRRIFTEYLEKMGHRCTTERFMILETALGHTGVFSADDLREVLDQSNKHISPATIYATLRLLCECGLLRSGISTGRHKVFEVSSEPGIWTVCRMCGKTKAVRDAELQAFVNGRRLGRFLTEHFTLSVHGLCSACQRKQRACAKNRNRSEII